MNTSLTPASLAGNLEVSLHYAHRKGTFPDGHFHEWTIPETTVAHVIAGRYEIEHAKGRFWIEPGELYVVQAGTRVSIRHHFGDSGRMEAQWVRFRATLFKTDDILRLFELPPTLTGRQAEDVGRIVAEIVRLGNSDEPIVAEDPRERLIDACRIPMLLLQLVQSLMEMSPLHTSALTLLDDTRRMGPVLEYIHDHLPETIHVEDMAAIACLSTSHFHAEFKAAFGQSPTHYIRTLRVREACRLLLHTSRQIQDIAETTGFGNAFYFCRAFKNLQGVSPSAYRKSNRLA